TAGTNIGTGTATGATGPVTGVVVNLAGDHSNQGALAALTALGIVLAVALPPGLAVWLRRRRGQARGWHQPGRTGAHARAGARGPAGNRRARGPPPAPAPPRPLAPPAPPPERPARAARAG